MTVTNPVGLLAKARRADRPWSTTPGVQWFKIDEDMPKGRLLVWRVSVAHPLVGNVEIQVLPREWIGDPGFAYTHWAKVPRGPMGMGGPAS